MNKTFAIILVVLSLFSGCKKDAEGVTQSNPIKDWLPFGAKHQWVFDVDSIVFRRDKTLPDTINFQIMELVDTFFDDNAGEMAFRIKMLRRNDTSDYWKFSRMFYAKLGDEVYERVDENIRYLKLSFPPVEGTIWNINSRNNLPPNMVYYQDMYEPYKNEFMAADTSITVVAGEINNFLEQYRYKEIYGKGFGLLYAEKTELLRQSGNWDGYKRIQKLVSTD